MLLGILTLVYSIFALATNVVASNNNSLGSNYTLDYLTISLASKQSNPIDLNKLYYYVQAWLGMVVVIIWGIIFFVNRYREFKNSQEYDDETISISDYSVSLQGIPLDASIEEIQTSFNMYYDNINMSRQLPANRTRPLKVVKLNVGKPFYLDDNAVRNKELERIDKEIEDIKDELRGWILERQERSTFSEPEEKRKDTYQQLAELIRQRDEKYR
jgi:hypothetical protein